MIEENVKTLLAEIGENPCGEKVTLLAATKTGTPEEICRAIHNMVGDVVGMVCDGAKADCALKISSCVNAAFQAAFMAMRGVRVMETDGIVERDVEKTLDNFATLGNKSSGPMDAAILDMMLNKEREGA